jgi:hypothetical protein
MLRIVNLEEIQGLLLRIPGLVDMMDQRDPDFVADVKQWLTTLEKALDSNRMPAAGNVAALRGLFISSEDGVIPSGIDFHGRPTKRKIRNATAALVLRGTGDLVSSVIQKDQERVSEAERLGRQLVALARAKQLIRQQPSGEDWKEMLKAIWRAMSDDPELSPGTTNLEGLVGPHDALIVLDRTISRDKPG